MLAIRQEQAAVFTRLAVNKFEEWMLVHLREFFPKHCAALGERRLHETIQDGIQRAATYGISARRDVCKYIDLMVVFGRDFEKDERLPWVKSILSQRIDPSTKMQRLFQAAKSHLTEG